MTLKNDLKLLIDKRIKQSWEGYLVGISFTKEDIEKINGYEPDVKAVGITWKSQPDSVLLLNNLNLRELKELKEYIGQHQPSGKEVIE